MKFSGKNIYLLIIFCGFICLSVLESNAVEVSVTPHDLLPEESVEIKGDKLPQWKIIWDAARKNALKGDFDEALHQYKALLKIKSNLQEARWELARLLMYLKRWEEAVEPLEFLNSSDPDSTLYISSLGKVMWELKQYERAVDLFHKIYLSNPTDQMALAGLVEGLSKLDRKREAIPYLEQLSRQEPTNRGVRRYLAFLLYDEGNYEKARPHLTVLARSEEAEPEVLYKTAKTYGHLGLEQRASLYWERFVSRRPENSEGHSFLADFYERADQPERALPHIRALLDIVPDDAALYARLGDVHDKSGDHEKAQKFYKKYLEMVPEDQVAKQRLVKIIATGAENKKVIASRGQKIAPGSEKKSAELAESILQLRSSSQHRAAVPLYRQLLELSPESPEILKGLAEGLIFLREKEGGEAMMKHLTAIASNNIGIYRSMAELFKQLNKDVELLEVLHKIHDLAPGDYITTRELAVLYLAKGDLLRSQIFFDKLSDAECWNAKCLKAGAELSRKLNRPEHELRYYERLLKRQPDRYTARLRVVYLAAHLGLLDTAVYHAGYLQNMPSVGEKIDLKVFLADAYLKSGYFDSARERYRRIIDGLAQQDDPETEHFRIRSWMGIAESFKETDLNYEAEQTLRSALAVEKSRIPILEGLLGLALSNGNVQLAEIWLGAFSHELEKLGPTSTEQYGLGWKKYSLRAEMLSAAGDYSQAAALCNKALLILNDTGNGNNKRNGLFQNRSAMLTINIQLAGNLIAAGEFSKAEKILLDLKKRYWMEPEPFVLLEKLYMAEGSYSQAEEVAAEAVVYAEEDSGRQLALARLYRKHNNQAGYLGFSEAAIKKMPDSLLAHRQIVEAKIAQQEYLKALDSLNLMQRSYPDNSWLLSRQAELLARTGNYQDALAVGDVILAENPARIDVVLLKARILWGMNRWRESVQLYGSITSPLVEDILKDRIQDVTPAVSADHSTESWWGMMTFSKEPSQSFIDVVMSPLHAIDFSKKSQSLNIIAAEYYSLFRWQERFSRELSVRRSVMRRDYYHAANILEDLIEEYGRVDFLLYDLGGLYSKLDRLGDEALVYMELESQNSDFPGLLEAKQRNNLKRRPQMFFSYSILENDGWNGYKAVEQEIMRGGGWYYQSVNRKWSIDLARINYDSTNDGQRLNSWRSAIKYNAKIAPALSISLGGGIEDMENGYGSVPLFHGSITGEIADSVWASFTVEQDTITDTLASLKRNIKRRDFKIDLIFDLLPRVVLGGYHDYIDYSDSNWTKNYNLWASFILLPEPTLLKISYNYDFYDSREGQKPGLPEADGFSLDDHPYWSPQNYWITRFSLYFKHQLSHDALARGTPSYYTLEYSLGYDSYDNDLHELKASFNIEIAENYILGGSYGYVDIDVYQYHETSLSIMYRW